MSEILKKLSILIVEDEEQIRNLLTEVMKEEFFDVYAAQNGDEGLKKFKKYTPSIVVSDISMPIVNGLDMALAIKELSPKTPIIALSAFSDREKLLKAIDVGIDKYLLKPIDMDELLSAIETLVKAKLSDVNSVEIGNGFSFNLTQKKLLKDGEEIHLTKKELAFVSLLVNRLGTLVLNDEIKRCVWLGESVNDAAIRTFIKRIREKLGNDMVVNIPGLGYKIDYK